MTPKLFGTDGIRGRALEWPLDEDTVLRLGVALARELRDSGCEPSILLAGDTRASTDTLAGLRPAPLSDGDLLPLGTPANPPAPVDVTAPSAPSVPSSRPAPSSRTTCPAPAPGHHRLRILHRLDDPVVEVRRQDRRRFDRGIPGVPVAEIVSQFVGPKNEHDTGAERDA